MPLAIHVFKDAMRCTKIVEMFREAEIEVFVCNRFIEIDSKHRFYEFAFKYISPTHSEVSDFVIVASEDMKVNWELIDIELEHISMCRYEKVKLLKSDIHVEKMDIAVESKNIPPELPAIDGEYRFRTFHAEKLDIKLYEVTRPGTEKPFTVVVNDVSAKGDLYFFTDIYGSKEWDMNRRECRFDYLFLTNLWEHLKMPGEFSMNYLKERTDRCYPGKLAEGQMPEAEPIVYRKSLEDVKQVLKRRYGDFS
jgi:hypothetical protein